ncbi:MAG: SWIM zinc finger family protein [Solibacillus sp.]
MHINQFENNISKIFITRGKKYFRDGHVVELAQISPTAWRAEVERTDDYFVFVELVNGRVATSVCNCPFDGPYCKHEVAVYYAMREALAVKRKFTLPEAVRTQSKEALLTLFERMVHDYPTLKSYFDATAPRETSHERSVQEAGANIVRLIHEFSGYDGTISEDYVDEAFQGFSDVLEEAQDAVMDDPVFAVRLLLVCQKELTSVQAACEAYVWDELFGTIQQATFEVIAEIQDEAAAKCVTELLMDELQSVTSVQDDPSLVLNMLIELSPFAGSRAQIEQKIKELVFPRDERAIYTLDLLLRLEADAEIADYYTKEPLATGLRERLIDHAVAKNDVDAALLLCANGINQADVSDYYKRNWLNKAFQLNGKQGNTHAQRFIAFELAVKGDMEDFTRLKSLYVEDAELWRDMFENYLLTLEDNRLPGHYAALLVQEEQWARLLRYCQVEPSRALNYASVLKPYYEAEVKELVSRYLQDKVHTLNSRGPYKGFANELLSYANSGYREHALALKASFMATYAKKRAFMEELQMIR